jgi:hypothetical protein
MISIEDVDRLVRGHGHVMTTSGDKIGNIGAIYPDPRSAQPAWVATKTGLTAGSALLVPLEGARIDGADILVPFSKEQIKDAPHIAAAQGPSEEDARRLREHYQPGARLRTYGEARREAGDDGVPGGGPGGAGSGGAGGGAGASRDAGGSPASGYEKALTEGESREASPDPITGDKEFLPDGQIGPAPVSEDELGGDVRGNG